MITNEPCCSSFCGDPNADPTAVVCKLGDYGTATTEIFTAVYMLLSLRLPFLFGTLYSLVPHWAILGVAGFWMLLVVGCTVFARMVAVTLGAKARQWKRSVLYKYKLYRSLAPSPQAAPPPLATLIF